MQITKDSAVTLQYKLSDPASGATLDTGHTAYLHGGYEGIFARVEQALEGQEVATPRPSNWRSKRPSGRATKAWC